MLHLLVSSSRTQSLTTTSSSSYAQALSQHVDEFEEPEGDLSELECQFFNALSQLRDELSSRDQASKLREAELQYQRMKLNEMKINLENKQRELERIGSSQGWITTGKSVQGTRKLEKDDVQISRELSKASQSLKEEQVLNKDLGFKLQQKTAIIKKLERQLQDQCTSFQDLSKVSREQEIEIKSLKNRMVQKREDDIAKFREKEVKPLRTQLAKEVETRDFKIAEVQREVSKKQAVSTLR